MGTQSPSWISEICHHAVSLRFAAIAGVGLLIARTIFQPALAQDAAGAVFDEPRLFRLAFSSDGSRLIGAGNAIRVFNVETGEPIQRVPIPRPQASNTLAVFPGRDPLYAHAGEDTDIRIRRVGDPQPVRLLQGHRGQLRSLSISPDGALVASAAGVLVEGRWKSTEFRLWDAGDGRLVRELDLEQKGFGCSSFSRDGKQLAVAFTSQIADEPSRVDVFDIRSWKRIHSIEFAPGFARSIYFEGDAGDMLIVGGDYPPVKNGCRPTGRIWIAPHAENSAREVAQDREYSYGALGADARREDRRCGLVDDHEQGRRPGWDCCVTRRKTRGGDCRTDHFSIRCRDGGAIA